MRAKSEVQIFLAHANEDKPQVRKLYQQLQTAGYRPWLDEMNLLPGQLWREEIPKALKKSDFFVACLSRQSIAKQGYVQREFRQALNQYADRPSGSIYLIPLKFDDCEIPDLRQEEYGVKLRDFQWLNFWQENGFERLVQAIEWQRGQQQATAKPEEPTQPPSVAPATQTGPKVSAQSSQQTSLEKQLRRAERGLQILQEQKAGFGLRFPVDLQLELEEKQAEVDRLKAEVYGSAGTAGDPPRTDAGQAEAREEAEPVGDDLARLNWSGDNKQLRKAILSVCPAGEGDLEIFVYDTFGENLAEVAGGDNLRQTVFRLIRWAEGEGALERLVESLAEDFPNNPEVKKLGIVAPQTEPLENAEPVQEAKTAAPSEGDFTEDLGGGVGLEMLAIPGGTFMMGSAVGEGYGEERPQHEVEIKPFHMGKYPITQAQWQAVAALPQVHRKIKSDPSRFEGGDRPVERVSWLEAVEFCDRLSRNTGHSYRLPSEAEWEYACRAGTTTAYHFGKKLTSSQANYGGQKDGTISVGSYAANSFGLYDMHGNVWEWCDDDWHNSYNGAPKDGGSWVKDVSDRSNTSKVLRGGSWGTVKNFV